MPDRVRFADLLEQHEREIHRFAFRMTGHLADAEDVLQNTFLRAFEAYGRLPATANHRAWLFRIALRQALNQRRAARVRRTAAIEAAADVCAPVPDENELGPDRAALESALAQLSERQRAALLLRKYEGLGYAEVAAALDCSEETARAHVYQATKKIRAARQRGQVRT